MIHKVVEDPQDFSIIPVFFYRPGCLLSPPNWISMMMKGIPILVSSIVFLVWTWQCHGFSQLPLHLPSRPRIGYPHRQPWHPHLDDRISPSGVLLLLQEQQRQQRKRRTLSLDHLEGVKGSIATTTTTTTTTTPGTRLFLSWRDWEGDDLRWMTRFRRRLRRLSLGSGDNPTPCKFSLMGLYVLFFLYQTMTTIFWIQEQYPTYWPSQAMSIISDTILGTSIQGPLQKDFGFSIAYASYQPHRYLMSSFLHGGIFHLLLNLDALRRQPAWLETGLGGPLYCTTFLISVIVGNSAHYLGIYKNNPFDRTLILGASGGICGLYGLMYGSLLRMGNTRGTFLVLRGMAITILSGLFMESISSMSHVGGFLCGIIIAMVFSPSYRKDYAMRRKNSVGYDSAPRDYRQVMGFGVMPTENGMVPLSLFFWSIGLGGLVMVATRPEFLQIPAIIIKGLLSPGSLTTMRPPPSGIPISLPATIRLNLRKFWK